MGPATPEQIAKRAPVTTTRLELGLEGSLALAGGPRWVVRAVPSMRQLASWPAEAADVAQAAFVAAARLVGAARAFSTRPHGTCPRCAGPLEAGSWCEPCGEAVTPAGPRVDAEEQAAKAARQATTRQAVELLRDRHA